MQNLRQGLVVIFKSLFIDSKQIALEGITSL